MERRRAVAMMESDREWVQGFLGGDAATNNPGLGECTHWIVSEFNGEVEVLVSVGEHSLISEEGFYSPDRTFEGWVQLLSTEGFPISDFD